MTVGVQPTVLQANTDLTNMTVQVRNLMAFLREKITYYQSIGTAGLEAVGFTSADATAFETMVSDLAAVSGVYYGTQFQGTAANNCIQFNFDSAFAPVWGGN